MTGYWPRKTALGKRRLLEIHVAVANSELLNIMRE